MDLCSLELVKSKLSTEVTTTEYDDEIQDILTSVSTSAENHMKRTVESGTYTEYLNVEIGQERFSLKAFPVTSVTNVWNDADWDYGTSMSTSNYRVSSKHDVLFVYKSVLITGFEALKVTYVGGMAATTAEFQTSYPDIANAIARQCAYQFRTRRTIGTQSVNTQMGNVAFIPDVVWLPEVKAVLNTHKRRVA